MAMDIIDQVKEDVLVAVLYTNGEPLLYQDLAKVILGLPPKPSDDRYFHQWTFI